MYYLYFDDIFIGEFTFAEIIKITQRNSHFWVHGTETLESVTEEYEMDLLFFGNDILWSLQDVIDDFNQETHFLERLGLL